MENSPNLSKNQPYARWYYSKRTPKVRYRRENRGVWTVNENPATVRGFVKDAWEEIPYDDVPPDVREQYEGLVAELNEQESSPDE